MKLFHVQMYYVHDNNHNIILVIMAKMRMNMMIMTMTVHNDSDKLVHDNDTNDKDDCDNPTKQKLQGAWCADGCACQLPTLSSPPARSSLSPSSKYK